MTLDQLRTIYTLADLCDMHEAMRAWDDAQDEARRAHETETGTGRLR
ncbi:hypothetical protein [Burkholderia sp. Bp9031]|nr:hypothetical protein [Burkholderia sp. Bp9031]